MNGTLTNPRARKKATNVSINSDLLARAKTLGINLSKTLEERLAEVVDAEQRRRWLDENRDSLNAYNRRLAETGVFGDGDRTF